MKSGKSPLDSINTGRIFSWLIKILTILVLATAIFAAYEYIVVRVIGYPLEIHLIDRQYRTIPINLEGCTATYLHATRRDTGRFFIYKIEDLHLINRWRMHLYPITSFFGKSNEYTSSINHGIQTLAARDRLIEANEKLQAKIEATESDVSVRSFKKEIAENLQKIRKLETSLNRYDIDYQTYENVDDTGGLIERLIGIIDRIAIRDDPTAE
jgi:hypothetical protein